MQTKKLIILARREEVMRSRRDLFTVTYNFHDKFVAQAFLMENELIN